MQNPSFSTCYHSPIGCIQIAGTESFISQILFCDGPGTESEYVPEVLKTGMQQLNEYFSGSRKDFDLPLQPAGTSFQQQVWQQLREISFGSTTSYVAVARAVSGEKAVRAVGAANGKNPICLVVPCHRVIGSDGSLTGYAGGLWRKEWLLKHEGVLAPDKQLTLF